MHARTQIRTAVMAALAGLATPVTIEAERRRRLDASLMPAVLVSLTDDAAQAGNRTMGTGPYDVETVQQVVIELHADGADGATVAAVLDQLDLEVEAALAVDVTLGGLVELVEPSESSLEMSADQDTVIGVRSVTYLATWRHTFGALDTPEG